MKKILLVTLVLAISGSILAQRPAPKPAASAQEDSVQYALGVYMMQQLLAKTGFTITNATVFKKAIDDVIGKKRLMVDPATTEARLLAYQRAYQLEKGRRLEQMLFEKARKEPNYTTLPTGVMYSVVKPGQGVIPSLRDTVIVNFNSTLADGTVIDDATKSRQSYMLLVSDMPAGLRDVMRTLREGSIAKALVPASQAYGSVGTNTIPPNSAIIYEIALVSVRPAR